jgi:hypothetical protein
MAGNKYLHIFLTDSKQSIPFSLGQGGGPPNIPQRDRREHSEFLMNRFEQIWRTYDSQKKTRLAASIPTKDGYYIQFKGKAGCDLITKSLENIRKGIRLLNVKEISQLEGEETYATVYIPNGQTDYFLKKIKDYSDPSKDIEGRNPKNQPLVNSIENILIASQLESFWQDSNDLMPSEAPLWCEVWLHFSEANKISDVLVNFFSNCDALDITFKEESLHFPERLVILIRANKKELEELIQRSEYIAEIRRAQDTASFWTRQTNEEQLEWIKDLLKRINVLDSLVTISILDSGVNNGHLLIQPILKDEDCHTYNSEWGIHDNDEHGTLISGVAGYDNLMEKISSSLPIDLSHKLESIKILPPKVADTNPYEHWGAITAQAISIAEISHPKYKRIFCMAVTSTTGTDRGRPSSWSSEIDSLAAGSGDGLPRVFLLSAGNVRTQEEWKEYPQSNKLCSIQNPAQSWNALTVGAFTKKIQINDVKFKDYRALAPADSLSPYSTTSFSWENYKWPNKPDIVMEGGNLAVAPDGFVGNHEDLSSLTTSAKSIKNQFDIIYGTSEATAHAAWLAGQLQVMYPNAWPQTIRGLIVHSAEWTKELISQFEIDPNRKSSIADLMKVCGYGVPNFQKAINSIRNSLTLIAQEEIQPFCKREKDGGYKSNVMHLFEFPWPKEELLALGAEIVRLRITLSYFIEPGPGEIGWKDRYRYASFGLRFDLNNPTENLDEFKTRINAAIARDEDYQKIKNDTDRWTIGSDLRHRGSVHSDFIEKAAADIASCNLIGVYPVVGWWRERTNLKMMENKCKYSLIVSLETQEQAVDLYTPIVNKIKIPVTIKI